MSKKSVLAWLERDVSSFSMAGKDQGKKKLV
jgi:hypothetical protein